MSDLKTIREGMDPVINAVLEAILDVSQIDPEFMSPDSKLGQDLGLDRGQVQMVLHTAARSLHLPVEFESCRIEDSSARQVVDILKRWRTQHSPAELKAV